MSLGTQILTKAWSALCIGKCIAGFAELDAGVRAQGQLMGASTFDSQKHSLTSVYCQ